MFEHGGFSLRQHLLDRRKLTPEDAQEFMQQVHDRLMPLNPRVSVQAYKNLPPKPAHMG